jgi:EAL domain-containing protein (putative c-di-GMP-specific phosphodiesterase class I)
MRDLRSDYGQGYHFSRPVAPDAIERLLSAALKLPDRGSI